MSLAGVRRATPVLCLARHLAPKLSHEPTRVWSLYSGGHYGVLDLQSSNKQLLIVHAGIVAAVLLSSLGGSKMFQAPSKEWIMHNYFGPQEVRVETPKVHYSSADIAKWRYAAMKAEAHRNGLPAPVQQSIQNVGSEQVAVDDDHRQHIIQQQERTNQLSQEDMLLIGQIGHHTVLLAKLQFKASSLERRCQQLRDLEADLIASCQYWCQQAAVYAAQNAAIEQTEDTQVPAASEARQTSYRETERQLYRVPRHQSHSQFFGGPADEIQLGVVECDSSSRSLPDADDAVDASCSVTFSPTTKQRMRRHHVTPEGSISSIGSRASCAGVAAFSSKVGHTATANSDIPAAEDSSSYLSEAQSDVSDSCVRLQIQQQVQEQEEHPKQGHAGSFSGKSTASSACESVSDADDSALLAGNSRSDMALESASEPQQLSGLRRQSSLDVFSNKLHQYYISTRERFRRSSSNASGRRSSSSSGRADRRSSSSSAGSRRAGLWDWGSTAASHATSARASAGGMQVG